MNGKAYWIQKSNEYIIKFYIWHDSYYDNWKMGEVKNFLSNTATYITEKLKKSDAPPNEIKWKIYKGGKWQITEDVQVSSGN